MVMGREVLINMGVCMVDGVTVDKNLRPLCLWVANWFDIVGIIFLFIFGNVML